MALLAQKINMLSWFSRGGLNV